MNVSFKTVIISSIFALASSHSVHAMQNEPTSLLVTARIQRELNYFKMAAQSSASSTRSCEESMGGIKWKLTAMKMANFSPFYVLDCSNKEIEKHFESQLKD